MYNNVFLILTLSICYIAYMDYHQVISNECNLSLAKDYMNVLRKSDWDTYDRQRIHDQKMHDSSMYSQQENIGDDDHDDGMAEWIDD